MDNLKQTLMEFIKNEFMTENRVTVLEDDSPLIKEGIIDSLGIFVLINFIDEQYGLKIQPEDILIQNFESINAISALVTHKGQQNSPH